MRELRNHLSEYIRRAEAGEQIAVTRRGKRVAVVAADGKGAAPWREVPPWLQKMADEGLVRLAKGPLKLPKKRFKLIGEGPTLSEMIIADRR